MMSPETIAAIIVAVIAATPGLVALSSQRKAANADAADKVTDAAVGLLEQYKLRIDMLEQTVEAQAKKLDVQMFDIQTMKQEITQLTKLLAEYQQGIAILTDQVQALGHSPRYRPAETVKREVTG